MGPIIFPIHIGPKYGPAGQPLDANLDPLIVSWYGDDTAPPEMVAIAITMYTIETSRAPCALLASVLTSDPAADVYLTGYPISADLPIFAEALFAVSEEYDLLAPFAFRLHVENRGWSPWASTVDPNNADHAPLASILVGCGLGGARYHGAYIRAMNESGNREPTGSILDHFFGVPA